jgi:hypothetical protein
LTATGQGFDILNYSGLRVRVSGFRQCIRAGAMVFAPLPYGRLAPAAIRFGQLLFS